MRIVKLGIISLVFFALFLTLLSLFFPSHVRISRATDIVAERDSIMRLLTDPRQVPQWLPINEEREGELYVKSKTDSSVIMTSDLISDKEQYMGWNIYPGNTPNTITVQWYMDFHLGWLPWNKFSGLLLEKRYGPAMEQGLNKLKSLLEGQ